jgi:sugar/nucleoside kinase (ribokinase family)
MEISVCVIGDIMLDVVTSLDASKLSDCSLLKTIPSNINTLPGGSGANFALAAVESGFKKVSLIAKVGGENKSNNCPDIFGHLIVRQLQKSGIKTLLAFDPLHSTGVAMIIYLNNGERVLIADKNANGSLTKSDISRTMRDAATKSDILFVSGYSLLEPKQARATSFLMEDARNCGSLVVLDVVPHSLYQFIDCAYFQNLTKAVHVLISELDTIKHLLFSTKKNLSGSNWSLEKVAEHLLEHYNAVVLRPNMGYQYAVDRQSIIEASSTGYKTMDTNLERGYSERLTAQLLFRHYTRLISSVQKNSKPSAQ